MGADIQFRFVVFALGSLSIALTVIAVFLQ
jgi:hypothetical protein